MSGKDDRREQDQDDAGNGGKQIGQTQRGPGEGQRSSPVGPEEDPAGDPSGPASGG